MGYKEKIQRQLSKCTNLVLYIVLKALNNIYLFKNEIIMYYITYYNTFK